MTDFANWNDTHFDAPAWELEGFEDESDWEFAMQFDDREQDGWSERYDYADEEFIPEDAHLDSYWEGLAESQAAFWGGE